MKDISRQLICWRLNQGLSQLDLSKRASVARANIINIENGRCDITLSTLNRLALAMGLSAAELFDQEAPFSKKMSLKQLNRHDWDKAARYILGEKVDLKPKIKKTLDFIKVLFHPLLEANGIPLSKSRVRKEARYPYYVMKKIFGKEDLNHLYQRVNKMLTFYQ